jgi:outer membrane murein-binding lipoprotein Lpp
MIARPSRLTTALAVTCVLVLAGCSKDAGATGGASGGASAGATSTATSSPSSGSGTPSATSGGTGTGTAAAGDAVPGRSASFTVVPPEGWAEATDRANGVKGIDLVLLSSKKVGSFANNLVVLSSPGDEQTLRDEMDQGRTQLQAAGRTVSAAPDQQVAGATATGFTSTFEQQGIKVAARSYGLVHRGRVYLLTLSSSQEDADHALTELDEILSSWSWS